MTVTWVAPVNTGGAALTGYRIQSSTDGGSSWSTVVENTGSTSTSQVVTGLVNGTEYVFRVAAINSVGVGGYSAASIGVTPSGGTPGVPTNVSAVAGNAEAVVTWTAPEAVSGGEITGYRIQASTDGGSTWETVVENTGSATASAVVSGLTNGTEYVFRVAAINEAGVGGYSQASNAVVPEPPSQPVIVIVGERGEVRGRPGIIVNGETEGFAVGTVLRPWFRFPGQTSDTEGVKLLLVGEDGGFTWQRQTGKKIYVTVRSADGIKSNRLIIPAR